MEIVILAVVVLIVVLLIGIPIPFAFFASTLVIVFLGDYDFTFLPPYGYSKAGSIILVAIPLFVMAGAFMEKGGIGESLVNLVELLVGRVKGGLGAVMVISCAVFGSISGSGMATLSCIGSIMLPRMYAAGYPRGISSALISSASLLGLLIPPSLSMILYAWVGGQSVLASFLSTIFPGFILIFLLSAVNFWLLRNNKDIKLPERLPGNESIKRFKSRSWRAIPALISPIIILGGIYGGLMTPTEAAAVSVVYSIPVGIWVYKGLHKPGAIINCMIESITTAGVIMIMLFSVMILSRLYIMENVPQMIMALLLSISSNRLILIMMVNLFMVIIGMLMDDTSAILLTTPILLPVVIQLGIHPIHFAAILGVNLGMGCITPPCAPFLYLGSRVGQAPVREMLGPTMYFIAFAWIPTLIITTYVPSVALFLPRLFGFV
jgi:tripartite ATP-independent transporter DctM subunit